MAGKIIADTLETGAGADIATSYVVNGTPKTWATLDGTGTIAFRDSFGQSAATDNGSGDYTFNFTNAFTDRNRCILLCNNKGEDTSRPYVSQEIYVPTAGTCRALFTLANSPTDSDTEDAYMVGLGDLA